MGADPTCDQINDWFKIGTQVRVATIPQSQLGGYPLDPETGKAAIVNYRPVCAAYRRYLDGVRGTSLVSHVTMFRRRNTYVVNVGGREGLHFSGRHYMLSPVHSSVVCNVRAPYSTG